MPKKAVPATVVDRKYQQALDLFERAVKALGKKDLGRARDLLDELLESHGDQQELVERARAYRAMCDRSLRPPRPKTFEELLNYGVVLHNRGDYAQAVRYLHLALEIHPRHEGALVLSRRRAGPGGRRPGRAQGAQVRHPRQPGQPGPGATRRRLRAAAGGGGVPGARGADALVSRAQPLAAQGVRIEDPSSTIVGPDVVVEAGAVLRPFTILEGRTVVRAGAVVGPFVRLVDVEVGTGAQILDHCLLRESVVEAGASVGPFAHLRPQSRVGERAKVGQLRRAQEDAPRRGLEGPAPLVPRATPPWAPGSTSGPAPSPATTTG